MLHPKIRCFVVCKVAKLYISYISVVVWPESPLHKSGMYICTISYCTDKIIAAAAIATTATITVAATVVIAATIANHLINR